MFCNHFGKLSRRLPLFKLINIQALTKDLRVRIYFTFSYAHYEVRSSEARGLGQEQVRRGVRQEVQVQEGQRDEAERGVHTHSQHPGKIIKNKFPNVFAKKGRFEKANVTPQNAEYTLTK